MGMKSSLRLIMVCVGCLSNPLALAQTDEDSSAVEPRDSKFSADLSAGVEFDGNISVDELDRNTSADDLAAIVDIDLGYDIAVGDNTELALGYSFSQSLHDEFTDFDTQVHFASIDLSHEFEPVKAGLAYRYADTLLDNDGLLELEQISPYLSRFFGKRFFVRADYTYTDKEFDNSDLRSATVNALGANVYWLINGVSTYVVIGYKYEDQDANGPQFDFQASSYRIRLSHRIQLGERHARLRLGWRYEDRDYDTITPQIGAVRDDQRHRFQASLELPIAKRAYASIEYEHAAFSSNLPSADFDQNVASVKLGMRF